MSLAIHVGTWTPLVTDDTGRSSSGTVGHIGANIRRVTSPCSLLTPLVAPAERSVTVDAEAVRLLVEIVGEDPEELASEVDKLAIWSGVTQSVSARSRSSLRVARRCRATTSPTRGGGAISSRC